MAKGRNRSLSGEPIRADAYKLKAPDVNYGGRFDYNTVEIAKNKPKQIEAPKANPAPKPAKIPKTKKGSRRQKDALMERLMKEHPAFK